MIIPAEDNSKFNLGIFFKKGVSFIAKNIKSTNVYVHCYAGISRSAAMIIAYLIKV